MPKLEKATPKIRNFGLGNGDERGEMLFEYLHNEQYLKSSHSRNGYGKNSDDSTKNEIENVITNNRIYCKDISVLSKFDIGNNHRLVSLDRSQCKKFNESKKQIFSCKSVRIEVRIYHKTLRNELKDMDRQYRNLYIK